MARHFSIPAALRQIPNELLQRLFVQLPYPVYCIDWGRLRERQAEAIAAVITLWPPEGQEFVERVLRNVFDLACERGYRALREAARARGAERLLEQLSAAGSLYAKSMWCWLQAPEVFEQALVFHEIEHLTRWRKRDDLPQADPLTDEHAIACLAQDVSRILVQAEGRGHQCTVEHFRRENGVDYFCCYPDDFVQTAMLHDEEGRLWARTVRQTFEIVFAYQRSEGVLELAAPLATSLKQQLEESFAWMILNEALGPRTPRAVYNLNRLKDRNFRLQTDPADEVRAVCRRLRIEIPHTGRRIVLESREGEADDVFRMVDECLDPDRVPREQVNISQATLQFLFRKVGRRRGGSMTVDVYWPNTCNLRNFPPEWAAVARKHFSLWRIADA